MTNSKEEKSHTKRVSVWLRKEDYPHSLNEEELQSPALALYNVFNQFSLADCQYLLWEWQHCHYRPFAFTFGDGLPTLFRFRKMLNKLLDVAWLVTSDLRDGHLLRVCTADRMTPLFDSHYFIALKKAHLNDLPGALKQMLRMGGGPRGWRNVLNYWEMGVSHEQLDDGRRTNPMDEIPEFAQLALIIEEGEKPFKTLMKIFSNWEYEKLKEHLGQLYYLLDFCMDNDGNLGKPNGIIHTLHKMIALGMLLAKKDDGYFELPDTFTFSEDEVGSFWEHDHYLPFHHLSKEEYENPVAAIRCFDLPALHRGLHRFTEYVASDHSHILDEEVVSFVTLFQQLERLLETLYILIVQRIDVEYETFINSQ